MRISDNTTYGRGRLRSMSAGLRSLLCRAAAVAVVALALPACDGGVVYDEYRPTQIEGWEKNDTLVFDVARLRHGGRYRQEIGLRINALYPFTRLSLLVEQTIEPGHRLAVDTLDCRLYDDKGNVLGDGVSYFQYNFMLSEVDLREGDSLHVCVRHIMKREILPGISDIGLKMVRNR